MKKATKISLWVIGTVIAVVILTMLCLSTIVTHFVHKGIDEALGDSTDIEVSVGYVQVLPLSGTVIVYDIHAATQGMALRDSTKPGMDVRIPVLTIANADYIRLIRQHELSIHHIILDEPQIRVVIDERNPETLLPAIQFGNTPDIHEWLTRIGAGRITVSELSARMKSVHSALDVEIDSLSISAHDLGYSFADSSFHYNDSVYSLSLSAAKVNLPDNLSAVEVHGLETANQGGLRLGRTRYRNTCAPEKFADYFKEPSTWIDMTIDSVSTAAFNPIRKALAGDYTLDWVKAGVQRMHVYRDARYKPKHPYPIPQDVMRQIPVIFEIKNVSATVSQVDVQLALTDINCGELHVQDIKAQMAHVTNRSGSVWYSKAHAPLGKKGAVDAQFNMYMDRNATFRLMLSGSNVESSVLNPLIRPLVAMTMDFMIDQVNADYKGDRKTANGDFCLQYHDFSMNVHKEDDVPYKIISKNAKFITAVANSMLPKQNPDKAGKRPRTYTVSWKNDEWKPYPLYLFGPCIDGAVKTLLPGLFISKKSKREFNKSNNPY